MKNFVSLLESIKTNNGYLVETILNGFNVLFENREVLYILANEVIKNPTSSDIKQFVKEIREDGSNNEIRGLIYRNNDIYVSKNCYHDSLVDGLQNDFNLSTHECSYIFSYYPDICELYINNYGTQLLKFNVFQEKYSSIINYLKQIFNIKSIRYGFKKEDILYL